MFNLTARKIKGKFLIAVFLIQMLVFLSTMNSNGKIPNENDNNIDTNRITIYGMPYFIVEEEVMYKLNRDNYYSKLIEILDVSDPKNIQPYSTYKINCSITDDCYMIAFHLFEEKLFIVKQYEYSSDPPSGQLALEIVDVSNPTHPTFLSNMLFKNTSLSKFSFSENKYCRMFFKNDFMITSIIDEYDINYNSSIRVINCTDIYHPIEIARENYDNNYLEDYYLCGDILYAITNVFGGKELTAYNLSNVTNLSKIFEKSWDDSFLNFIGEINGYLITHTLDHNHTIYWINTTKYNLTSVSDIEMDYDNLQSFIHNEIIYTINSQSLKIYKISESFSYDELGNFFHKIPGYELRFERLLIDGSRAYIGCEAYDEEKILYIIDISDSANPKLLLPEKINIFLPILILSMIFGLSIISLIVLRRISKK